MPEAAVTALAPPGTAAVVLAAGSSTRMGENKMLLALDGEPLIARAVRAACAAGLSPVVVVLGHEAERARAALDGIQCRPVVNPDHARGKGTSIQFGIAEVARATGADAAVVVLADMPFVTASMMAAVAQAASCECGAPTRMVISRYGGEVTAPPILYARELFDELCGLPSQACGKEMQRRYRHEAAFVDWPAAALADVDVPEDYARLRDAGGGGG